MLWKTAFSLFEFRDLLPIHDVYKSYCKLGEPHTARDFLKATCVPKGSEPPCYLKGRNQTQTKPQTLKLTTRRGFNAVPVGLNIMFLPEGNLELLVIRICQMYFWNEIAETEEYQPIVETEYEDPFFDNLITLRRLGIKTIVRCLAEVCPKIYQEGMVVNIDYPLSFLEFYEVVLLCAYKIVDKKQREKEALEQQLRLEEALESPPQTERVAVIASERRLRVNSKDKKKSRGK